MDIDKVADMTTPDAPPTPAQRPRLGKTVRMLGSKHRNAQKHRTSPDTRVTRQELRKAINEVKDTLDTPRSETAQPDSAPRPDAALRADAPHPESPTAVHAKAKAGVPDATPEAVPHAEAQPHGTPKPSPFAPVAAWMAWLRDNLRTSISAGVHQIARLDIPTLINNPYVQAIACGAVLGLLVGTCLPAGLLAESVLVTQLLCKAAGMGVAASLRYFYEHPFVGLCAVAGAAVAVVVASVTCGAGVMAGIVAGVGGAMIGGFAGHKLENASLEIKMALLLFAASSVMTSAFKA